MTVPVAARTALPALDRRSGRRGIAFVRPVRWRRRPGSAARLAGLHALVLAIVLGGVVAALVRNFTLSYEAAAGQTLAAQARAFQQAAGGRPVGQDTLTFAEQYLRTHAEPAGNVVAVFVPGLGSVGSPGTAALLADPSTRALLASAPRTATLRASQIAGEPTELLVAPITEGRARSGWLVESASLETFSDEGARLLTLSLLGAAVALVAGVTSAFLLLRRLLGQVGRITRAADDIGRGDLHRRLGAQGTDDEVGQLARSFDQMIDHLDTAVTAQRQLLSDVSHQLRTPLTVARGHLEVLERTEIADPAATLATIATVVDELDHMRSLVDRLQLLGRAMETNRARFEPVDLRELMADLFESSRIIAERDWRLLPVPDLVLAGDASMLRGALLNLVDNAIKSTGTEDILAVRADLSADGRYLALSIDDSGPGIPPGERAAVLTRFARPGARDEGGTGLGLAIVKAVAEAHGGRLEVGDSPFGGARVSIVLPAFPVGRA